jgi:hypothetical protein
MPDTVPQVLLLPQVDELLSMESEAEIIRKAGPLILSCRNRELNGKGT